MTENVPFLDFVLFHITAHPVTTLLATCLMLLYVYFKNSYTYWESRGVPQLNPSFPFGDMAKVIFRRQNMAYKLKEIYDQARTYSQKYVGLYFFSRKVILAVDPVLIKDILATNFMNFSDRGLYYDEKNDPLNAHLFSLTEPKWRKLRTKLTPAYSPKQLRNMFGTILDCGLKMKEFLGETASSGQPMEIKETFARYTTDVIGSCAYGLECNTLRNPNAEFRLMGKRAFTQTLGDLFRIIIIRCFPRLAQLLGIGVFSSEVTNFFRKVVRETIEYRENNNIHRDDFLQLLVNLKNNKNLNVSDEKTVPALTMDEAAAQAFIFFLAGFETTSSTTSFAIFEMAMNNDIQHRASEEVRRVLKEHDGVWSYEAIQELTYLEMVVKETLRKYPVAPVFMRKCTESYRLPHGRAKIEEGFTVLIPCFALHRDPQYYPDPDLFDPERFSEVNRTKIWDYTYMPFGDGPRMCIGMRFSTLQIKITLALLLSDFIFHINSKTELPIVMENHGILLAPAKGIWIDLKSTD